MLAQILKMGGNLVAQSVVVPLPIPEQAVCVYLLAEVTFVFLCDRRGQSREALEVAGSAGTVVRVQVTLSVELVVVVIMRDAVEWNNICRIVLRSRSNTCT